jgi:hypothetical protein
MKRRKVTQLFKFLPIIISQHIEQSFVKLYFCKLLILVEKYFRNSKYNDISVLVLYSE